MTTPRTAPRNRKLSRDDQPRRSRRTSASGSSRRRQAPAPRRRGPRLALLFSAVAVVSIVAALSFAGGDADAGSAQSAPEECAPCHTAAESQAVFSHERHAEQYGCIDCHEPPQPDHYAEDSAPPADCAQCHSPERPFSEPRLSHTTFGEHTFAVECASCHDAAATDQPSCRSCHGDICGKGVTTVEGCLECHNTGTTENWLDTP